MLALIRTVHGTYNLIGTDEGMFYVQGNLTLEQLRELYDAIRKELEEVIVT